MKDWSEEWDSRENRWKEAQMGSPNEKRWNKLYLGLGVIGTAMLIAFLYLS